MGQVDHQVTPYQLDWVLSAQLIVATVLGGSCHFLGPVYGALAVVGRDEIALRFALCHGLIFGILLAVVVLALPEGLMGAVTRLQERIASRSARNAARGGQATADTVDT